MKLSLRKGEGWGKGGTIAWEMGRLIPSMGVDLKKDSRVGGGEQ